MRLFIRHCNSSLSCCCCRSLREGSSPKLSFCHLLASLSVKFMTCAHGRMPLQLFYRRRLDNHVVEMTGRCVHLPFVLTSSGHESFTSKYQDSDRTVPRGTSTGRRQSPVLQQLSTAQLSAVAAYAGKIRFIYFLL